MSYSYQIRRLMPNSRIDTEAQMPWPLDKIDLRR